MRASLRHRLASGTVRMSIHTYRRHRRDRWHADDGGNKSVTSHTSSSCEPVSQREAVSFANRHRAAHPLLALAASCQCRLAGSIRGGVGSTAAGAVVADPGAL
jgi:hypothetical protein